jgi:excisionase family DNA binding protein
MKRSTGQIISTVVRDDDSVDPDVARAVVRQLEGRTATSEPSALLLNPAETARLLGVSRQTLWRLSKSGELVPLKVGAGTRYRRSDVDGYVARLPGQEVQCDAS